MYTEKDLKKLKGEYIEVKAPKEVTVMAKSILNDNKKTKKEKENLKLLRPISAFVASFILIFTLLLNSVPAFALVVTSIPILGSTAKFLTFTTFHESSENHDYLIQDAKLEGLEDNELSRLLNEKYNIQSIELYDELMSRRNNGSEPLSFQSTYIIKADNGVTISIEHSIYESMASSSQIYEYDTIDIINEVYITLPSLFKDESYIKIISQNIKEQMETNELLNDNITYFKQEDDLGNIIGYEFDFIDSNQEFYINNDHQLVIVFNKYEIASGYMGAVEFTIPTEVIKDILVDTSYIK